MEGPIIEFFRIFIVSLLMQHFDCSVGITLNGIDQVSILIWRDCAPWTGILLATYHEALFRVISDVCCKDRVDFAYETISTVHPDTITASPHQQPHKNLHCLMKELILFYRSFLFREALKLQCRNIPKQSHCACRKLVPGFTVHVSNIKVHQVSLLVTTKYS